ncbi:MHYT domain-containing protein [Minwuia thermotolerans]|uniref:histidine kinase n=1 Tax=Minwuia thermotolerans TaxID=2056226 RepID=A0A2M9FZK0_9PROT|nr:MHYT domain-containing protein [Minwuia thermotolerans]PJK28901.1 hypothetical protein CVT23_14830 [Minwuia thermotolerans]
MDLHGHHDPVLVALAVAVGISAAFGALNLGARARAARGGRVWLWTALAATTFGSGVWSMHFIAILAMTLPGIPVSYDPVMTGVSLAIAIAVALVGQALLTGGGGGRLRLIFAGAVMGLGIAAMHYAGMSAMRMPAVAVYDSPMVALSVVIGIAAATLALWLFNRDNSARRNLAAAPLMGLAIGAMHYTGMMGVDYLPVSGMQPSDFASIYPNLLAVIIAGIIALVCFGGFAFVSLDRRSATALEAAYDRIRRSERRFSLMVNGLKDCAVFMLDREGRIESWNDGAARQFGWTEADIVGLPSWVLNLRGERAARSLARALKKARRQGRNEFDMRAIRADGSEFWANTIIYPVREDTGEMTGFVATMRDISEQRRSREALAAANAELERKVEDRTMALARAKEAAEAANSAKSRFIANMSHELRTPLNAIIGYTEMLLEDFEAEGETQTTEDLKRIEGAGRHLLDLINEILDIAKIEAGRYTFDHDIVDVRALVGEAVATAEPMVERHESRMHVHVDAAVDTIETDRKRLFQCLLNLLSNAAKFTRAGDIWLDVAIEGGGARRMLTLTVRDTGIGMSADQLDRVFEAFAQVDDRATRGAEGTGLGLTITRRLIEAMGGDIAVESAPGEGSTFTIRAPLEPVEETATEAAAPVDAAAAAATRVVMIDDDAATLALYRRQLERENHEVYTADTGEEGVALVRRVLPDLVLLDMSLPDRSGAEVLAELRADAATVAIPVAIVSGSEREEHHAVLDAVEWLTKPVGGEALAALVGRFGCAAAAGRALILSDRPQVQSRMTAVLERSGWQALTVSDPEHLTETLLQGVRAAFVDTARFGGAEMVARLARSGVAAIRLVDPAEGPPAGEGPSLTLPETDDAELPADLLREAAAAWSRRAA